MKPKLDIGLFVDLAEFLCFYAVLAWPDHKIVLQIKAKQFYDQKMAIFLTLCSENVLT